MPDNRPESQMYPSAMLTFGAYQARATETAIYPMPGRVEGLMYVALGLTGEAGEIANKVKKIFRDGDGRLSPEQRDDLIAELGDVLWYVAMLADELDVPLHYAASQNLQKLSDRAARGVIGGAGDRR